MIVFGVHYDYFWRELSSLMSIAIILYVDYDDLSSYLCLCGVYFIS